MLLYLHGLDSSGESKKASVLREAFAPVEVLSPTYRPHRPKEAVQQLGALLDALPRPPVVVGSSMGGFYGQWLARRHRMRHLVLINPALRPWELADAHAGWRRNPVTGEGYELTRTEFEALRAFGLERAEPVVPTTLFLDQGDEVIPWAQAAEFYRDHGEVHAFPGGSHAFDHMAELLTWLRERCFPAYSRISTRQIG